MLDLFLDQKLQNKINGTLIDENKLYYARLKVHDPNIIEKEITQGQCSRFIHWNPNNMVGEIIFRNVIGYVNLFGDEFEVRSTKLLTDLSGIDQIEYILKDISEYSDTLIFSPGAPSAFNYQIDNRKLTNNPYYIYKYLSGHLFQDGKYSLQHLLDIIFVNPHINQYTTPGYIPTFSTKKFNNSTFSRLARGVFDAELIPQSHKLFKNAFIAKMPQMPTGEKIVPKQLYSVTNTISTDTAENRFLKYFLLWCQEIYMSVYNLYPQYQVRDECLKSLRIIRKYLSHPFFKNIGKFSFLPLSSSVLINRAGYKEIFMHYINCRSKPRYFSDYLADIVNRMEVKSISTLYEYWVFFKIAEALFGSGAELEIIGQHKDDNIFKYGLKILNGSSSLYYNKTYLHSPEDSYNFRFRPDISLEIKKDGEIRRYFFDAKYSNVEIPSNEDEPAAVYKNVNVVKMLSYLEAIKSSNIAVIVYPGTKFSFYNRNFSAGDNHVNFAELMTTFNGVGALPLSPGTEKLSAQFNKFMDGLKTSLEI